MSKEENSKPFDLEGRTFLFAQRTREFIKKLNKTIANIEDMRQLVRSSGSVGANYIEANEACSKKDFLLRIKYCRKEAKESRYWLRLLDATARGNDERARYAYSRSAGIDEHFWGDCAKERVNGPS